MQINGTIFESVLLSDEELERLILLFLYQRRETGANDSEIRSLIAWADRARLESNFLRNILEGYMLPDWQDGDVSFRLTPLGQTRSETLANALKTQSPKETPDEPTHLPDGNTGR